MKSYPKKGWIECRNCQKDDPCLIYMPKQARKRFPKDYCFLDGFYNEDGERKGKWKKPEWAKQELTV